MNDARLTRIEKKVDRLGDALAEIARIEERTAFYNQSINKLADRIDDLDKRVRTVSGDEQKSSSRAVVIERLVWGTIAVGLSVLAFFGDNMVGS